MKKQAFVVTGAGRGLGRTIAIEASTAGFPVALLSRTGTDLESVKNELSKLPNKQLVTAHAVDLRDAQATQHTFQQIKVVHGGISALVNNAGTWTGGKVVKELSEDDLKVSLALNFFSAFNATKGALGIRDGSPDSSLCIVTVGATASLRGGKRSSSFCIAKGALRSLSQSLAKEMGPEGVHVAHLVIDGLIDNPRTRSLNPSLPPESFINPVSIARSILNVVMQERSCWTFEWEVRPYNEKW